MHYFSVQKVCGTCNSWKGSRMFDEAQFVCCPKNVSGNCISTRNVSAPDSTCPEWTKWENDWSNRTYLKDVNCWEYTGCGFEEGGQNAARHGVCSAFPDHGRLCASLENTKCHLGCREGWGVLLISRNRTCNQCPFYQNFLAPAGLSSNLCKRDFV